MSEPWRVQPGPPFAAPVRALATTRYGLGASVAPYDAFNLGDHVGDDPLAVATNREQLRIAAALPSPPRWLRQVHGVAVANLDARVDTIDIPEADASFTRTPGVVCAVLTADCLPVLLAADDGTEVGAIHAGWRGLAAGVIEATVAGMATPAVRLHAWLGPAIGARAYEVDALVRDAFARVHPLPDGAFVATREGHWTCDLYALARQRLRNLGIARITGGDQCTATMADRYFSHRRDGVGGRQATLIWINPSNARSALNPGELPA